MSTTEGITANEAEKVQLKYSFSTAAAWLLLYILLATLPLLLAFAGERPAGRGTVIEMGVALGFIGLAMMALQSLFGGRFRTIAPSYGMDNILQFHREIGIIATVLVLAHPVMMIAGDPTYWAFFDPRVNLMRAIALIFVLIAVPAITLSSIWRTLFGLSYEKWRLLHGFLGLAIVFVGIVHSIQVSHYLDPLWKKIVLAALMGASMYLVLHSRIVRPWRSRKLPYVLEQVNKERGEAHTLVLRSRHGSRLNFLPGQFIWITLGRTPFSLQQHPFSIASGGTEPVIRITAKELGDLTSTFDQLPPGTTAFIEGPYGSFTPHPASDIFLIMGGIGITPAMSMLRTMKATKSRRRAILLYANKDAEGIHFREELEELASAIDLQVVHVLEEVPGGFKGVQGRLDHELIGRYLPENPHRYTYFICGPGPLMDAAETSLRDHGIPWRNIYTERFEIV